jgi:catechol 2,3-dioxygenase-like lactoylglutathione lyase family enzyme
MQQVISEALKQFETGLLTRRELVATLAALLTGHGAAVAQPVQIHAKTLNHVTLRVADVDRSVKFYQQLFAFPIVNRQPTSIGLGVGNSHIGLSRVQGSEQPHINHLCFGVAQFDTDRTIAALATHGVKGAVRMRGDFRELYFADPDNLSVQLQDENYHG